MVADQQTHRLPVDPEALDRVAWLDGLDDGAELLAEVRAITDTVGERYDALVAASPGAETVRSTATPETLAAQLETLGFEDPSALAARIAGWRSGKMKALRSDAARMAFDRIQPDLLAAFARAPEPMRALVRWEQLLAGLPSAINLFRLLEARPALIGQLVRILGIAPPLADALARRADLLDPLIDASAFELPGDVPSLVAEFTRGEAGEGYEELLDRVRRRVGEHRFTLGVQLIEARSDPLDVSAALARVAEAAIVVLGEAAQAEFRTVHGSVPGSEPLVLGLGRMGGGALTHASDLDLVFLFTGEFDAESDGRRPLGATQYYNRLSQRMISALSVATAQGALYEVDTRLRPSGDQGPPAASLASFARYQREQAWTWEHMALCRARPLYGSAGAREALAAVIREVLTQPRDAAKLREDILAMRTRMAQHKPPKGELDVKLARGGLVDLEFVTHFLQLREGVGLVPELGEAVRQQAAAGLVPAGLPGAHDALSRALVAARLLAPDSETPSASAQAALASACGCGDWREFLSQLAAARAEVAGVWTAVFDEALETL
jgi:glutamate-ammonia-ligase adenylyltransferase